MNALRRFAVSALLLLAVPAVAGATVSLELGRDRMGSDYKGFATGADPDACRQACAGEAACQAYTYVKPGVKGPEAMCFLKSAAPPSVSDSCCISGAKTVQLARGSIAMSSLAVLPPQPCVTLHVDAARRGQRDGSAAFPYETLTAAIGSATARHCPIIIALAAGNYREDITVNQDLTIKGADRHSTVIQGTLRATGHHRTVLWDLGFAHVSPMALYKEDGTIELQRIDVTDVKYADAGAYASPGTVHIVDASGVVNGLVFDNTSSPALLVEGASARIKSFGLVVSHSVPAVEVTNALRSVGAVEVRNGASMMGNLWKITDNQTFGVAVTTKGSLYLANSEVKNTTEVSDALGPDNLLVANGGILEIDHVTSTGAGRAGALSTAAFLTAHHSKLRLNQYGFVNQSTDVYPDGGAALRCATADDVLIEANSEQGIVSDGSLAIPNAPLCTPGVECQEQAPDLSQCARAVRW